MNVERHTALEIKHKETIERLEDVESSNASVQNELKEQVQRLETSMKELNKEKENAKAHFEAEMAKSGEKLMKDELNSAGQASQTGT